MTQLHQIQLKYVALEDRALMRVATRDRQEFRFWVTRRYAALMLAALSRNLEKGPAASAQQQPAHRSAVLAFEREAALSGSDFDTAYRGGCVATPLGQTPLLLARLGVRRLDAATTVLALHPRSGQGIEVRLNDTLIHSLVKLLEDAARAGGWALAATLDASPPASDSQPLN